MKYFKKKNVLFIYSNTGLALKIYLTIVIILTLFSCNQNKTNTENQIFIEDKNAIRTKRTDSIENFKEYILSSNLSFIDKKYILDSAMISTCQDSNPSNNSALIDIEGSDYGCFIIHFDYKQIDSIDKLNKDSNYNKVPQGFINCIKSRIPLYLLVKPDGKINHPAGNKYADFGMRRQDVGPAWDYGNYGAYSEYSSYSLSLLYLDKKYDSTDIEFQESLIRRGSAEWFGQIEVGHTEKGKNKNDLNSLIYYNGKQKGTGLVDDKLYGNKFNTLVGYIFQYNNTAKKINELSKTRFVFDNRRWNSSEYYKGSLVNNKITSNLLEIANTSNNLEKLPFFDDSVRTNINAQTFISVKISSANFIEIASRDKIFEKIKENIQLEANEIRDKKGEGNFVYFTNISPNKIIISVAPLMISLELEKIKNIWKIVSVENYDD